MKKVIVINGYGFYPASYEGKNLADFIKEMEKPTGFSKEQLNEAYKTLTAKPAAEAPAPATT